MIFEKNQLLKHLKAKFLFSTRKPPQINFFQDLESDDVNCFKSILQSSQFSQDQDELQTHNRDWMKVFKGNSKLLLKPKSSEKLAQILKYCNEKQIAVNIQGGNTGLVGGSVPVYDEVIISLKNLNKVHGFCSDSKVISCDSGAILESLNKYLTPFNCQIPLDLGAKGSCFIGGNISTHAGGKYFVKYGSLRGNILGLQVVLANGSVLDLRSKLRKDNTGYDLKQLFIGAQGTLGVITKADILCHSIESRKNLIMLKTDSFFKVLNVLRKSKQLLGQNLIAFEYMDGYAMGAVLEQLSEKAKNPFSQTHISKDNLYCLLQVASNTDPSQMIEKLFEALQIEDLFNDAILTENERQYEEVWLLRQQCALAANQIGKVLKYDLSIDPALWSDFALEIRQKVGSLAYLMSYGHIADGNIHLNVCAIEQKNFDKLEQILEPYIFERVGQMKGSISAEHGIGLAQTTYLPLQKSADVLELMKKMKMLFDPNGILNPYQII